MDVATAAPRGAARLPSLDGIRALAIIAVLAGHLIGTRNYPAVLGTLTRNAWLDLAMLGVRVFFVLSGLLITTLLLEEHARPGGISLARFYQRRALRILPAYLAFVAVVAILAFSGMIVVSGADFARALTFTMNYSWDYHWHVGHLWSLSVEEQFYLVWPAALALAGIARAKRFALAVVLLAPLVRLLEAATMHDHLVLIGHTFETTADALGAGCLLALYRDELWSRAWYRTLLATWLPPLALLLCGLALSVAAHYRSGLLLGATLCNVSLAMLIDRAVRVPGGLAGRVLNWKPLMFVGVLSYSIYLWQQLFLYRYSSAVIHSFPLNLAGVFAAALASYYLVEQPALRWRRRITGEREKPIDVELAGATFEREPASSVAPAQ